MTTESPDLDHLDPAQLIAKGRGHDEPKPVVIAADADPVELIRAGRGYLAHVMPEREVK